jgi:flagellar basal body-associated protein FliL
MADETQKPKEDKAEKKEAAPGIMVLAGIMIAGAFLSSFLTAKFMAPSGGGNPAVKEAGKDPGSIPTKDKAKEKTIYYKLGEFIVNLSNKEATRYLKTDITMEVKDAKEIDKAIKEKEAIYRDTILEKLSGYTTQQLGLPDGKKNMKQEIISSIADLDPDIKVVNIYFNALMMQ